MTRQRKINLIGADAAELGDVLAGLGVAQSALKMRIQQIRQWIYVHGARDFAAMTNIAKPLRDELAKQCTLERPQIAAEQISNDGTRKWLLRLDDTDSRAVNAPEVECVYIPEPSRGTLCISSQIGCTLNCTFCHTGTQSLVRNLNAGEIVSQILIVKDALGDWPHLDGVEPGQNIVPEGRPITNVVFMGMGEPLYNFDAVKQATHIICDNEGLSISKRRITLSTAGVVPMIERCGDEIGVMLAISLHGVSDDIRDRLVPLNRKYPLDQLLNACRNYPGLSNARRITFEYVMLNGVNDTKQDARELVKLLQGIPAKINLIPFNPWPGAPYECSSWEVIEQFAQIINKAGYASPVRTPRGRDIMAACGQLKSASEKARKSRTVKNAAGTAALA